MADEPTTNPTPEEAKTNAPAPEAATTPSQPAEEPKAPAKKKTEAPKKAEEGDDTPAKQEVPATAQTAPSDVDLDTGKQPGVEEAAATETPPNETKVTQHLDRDLNDPRNAEPTPQLPSLNDEGQQGPAHGRVSNEDDHTPAGQNGPNV